MAHRHGDVGVAQLEGKGAKHAVIKAEGSTRGSCCPLCQCAGALTPFPVAHEDQLVEGRVTCRDCRRTYRLLKQIMEGK